jgi:hypothetical protein
MPFPFDMKKKDDGGEEKAPKKFGKSILGADSGPPESDELSEEEIHGRALAKSLERKDYKAICQAVKDIMSGYDGGSGDDDME